MRHLKSTISDIKSILREQGDFKSQGRNACSYDSSFLPAAAFSILASFHKQNPNTLAIESFSNQTVRSFMERANLFHVAGCSGKSCFSGGSENLLEASSVTNDGETNEIGKRIRSVSESFSRRNDIGNFFLENLEYVSIELMNNVLDHSQAVSSNFVAAMNYSGSEPFMQVAVADSGIGILNDIKQKYPEIISHRDAISKAFEGHVTGRVPSSPYEQSSNAGLGLTVTSKMVCSNAGDFVIGSGDALYVFDSQIGEWRFDTIPYWQGTFVFFNTYPQKGNPFDSSLVLEQIYEKIVEKPLDIDFE